MAMQNLMLKQRYNLHASDEVKSATKRTQGKTGEKVPQDPEVQIQNYLDRFSEILERTDEKDREKGIKALKKMAHDRFVTQYEDISESYWELQERIIRERGQEADYRYLSEEQKEAAKKQLVEGLRDDQKQSLDVWIDYLASSDSGYMPDYIKYWVFRSIVGLQEYDKEKNQFPKRSKGTVNMFPELNQEALAYVIDAVLKKHKNIPLSFDELEERLTDEQKEQFKKNLSSENFGKLYAWASEQLKPISESLLQEVEGKWVKYDQGSDHIPLVASLRGKNTGWCTAGENTAMYQLQSGDFYVYYSNDEEGKPTVPRIAIRMEGGKIAEIRGVASSQNLESNMEDVLREKLEEFPDKDKYLKKEADMKKLTEVENKTKKGEDLSVEDLIFLHEVKALIEGFGYSRDPRIKEILDQRNQYKDWLLVVKHVQGTFKGYFDLSHLTSPEGLIIPESFRGKLDLSGLTSVKGLVIPESAEILLNYGKLTSAEGLVIPESFRGYLDLSGLTSAKGLIIPESFRGHLDLSGLTSAKGLIIPESLGRDSRGLTSAKYLEIPEPIVNLSGLTSAEDLKIPDSVRVELDLDRLTTAKGLKVSGLENGYDLRSFTSAEGLDLSSALIDGYLGLSGLTSAKGLKLPESISGDLDLSGLTSAEGLDLSSISIDGYLNLGGLTSAEGLDLSSTLIRGGLNLRCLTSAEGLKLPQSINGHLDLRGLTSAKGLKLPESISGNLYLSSLTSAEGLDLSSTVIDGKLYLDDLRFTEIKKLELKYPKLSIEYRDPYRYM